MILFASDCNFARAIFRALADHALAPAALVLPGHRSLTTPISVTMPKLRMPMAGTEPGIVEIAHNQGTPVFRIGRPTPDMVAQIPQVGNRPVLISACYSRLIPEDTLALFDKTSVNIHPSLLPDLRGPDPMFWTFQRGTRVSGVSLHRMTSGFDAGPVVASQATEWVENQTERELEERLASVAVRLLDTYLANPVPGVEQDHTRATWAPVPGIEDFTVGPDWTEQRTNDFIRGISGRGIPVRFR